MFTKESAIDYAMQYLNECIKNKIRIKNAFVFGSHALGMQREHSDVDIAIVSDMFGENPIVNWRMLSNANIKFVRVEPHLFSPHNFNAGNPFIAEIKKTGIPLIE